MKFVVALCLLALAAADEDKNQEKKTQAADTPQNPAAPATGSLLNTQPFPSPAFTSPISNLAYTGFGGLQPQLQGVNPSFFTTGAAAPSSGVIPSFPVTRASLPGASAVVNGIQSAFPVTSGVFGSQYPSLASGLLSAATSIPSVLGANTAVPNGGISSVAGSPYKFVSPDVLSQAFQTAQSVGLPAVPAFTSGILPTLSNAVLQGLQGQAIPNAGLKNPTVGANSGVSNPPALSQGNISSGPLGNVFRQA